jgi:hypothetical protein
MEKEMILTPDHPDAAITIVFLDDKPLKVYLAADDEEGWVDLPDLKAMVEDTVVDVVDEGKVEEWEEIPTARKYGKVEFRKLVSG